MKCVQPGYHYYGFLPRPGINVHEVAKSEQDRLVKLVSASGRVRVEVRCGDWLGRVKRSTMFNYRPAC
jgi:hypothetical protein